MAERDYPCVHTFIYIIRVTVPADGEWPLAAVLDRAPQVSRAELALSSTSAPAQIAAQMLAVASFGVVEPLGGQVVIVRYSSDAEVEARRASAEEPGSMTTLDSGR